MSLSTKNPPAAPPPTDTLPPRWQQRDLSPLRGLLGLGGFAVTIAVIASFYDVLGHFLLETAHLGMEIAEELMDTAFELLGMAPGTAQMTTAYVGLTLPLVLAYFAFRKMLIWSRRFQETLQDYRDLYLHILRTWSKEVRHELIRRWESLDWLGKIAAGLGTVLILVPLILGIAIGLATLISMALF